MPPYKIINTHIPKTTKAPPKSGCLLIKNTNTKVSIKLSTTFLTLKYLLFKGCKTEAKTIISVTLTNSEGWKLKAPKLNQRTAPLIFSPNFKTEIKISPKTKISFGNYN